MIYIAVIHNWFAGQSDGFTIVELKSTDKEMAYLESLKLKEEHSGRLSHCAVKVIELKENEILAKPRRLTLLERITGWTTPYIHNHQ